MVGHLNYIHLTIYHMYRLYLTLHLNLKHNNIDHEFWLPFSNIIPVNYTDR